MKNIREKLPLAEKWPSFNTFLFKEIPARIEMFLLDVPTISLTYFLNLRKIWLSTSL